MNQENQTFDQAELDKFNQHAEHWWNRNGPLKTLHDINPIRVDFILKEMNLTDLQGLRIADIGCGGGILSESLALRGASVTGLDLSEHAIESARSHAAGLELPIDYQTRDVGAFSEEHANQFDIVTCMEMLEHVPDPNYIIRACSKLLKPSGHLFASTLNRTLQSYLFAILGAEYILNILPKKTHDYKKFITPSELSKICRSNGLTVRDVTGVQYNPCTRTASLVSGLGVNYLIHAQAKTR